MKKFKFFAFFAVCVFFPFFVSCQNKKFNLSVEEIEILTSAGNSVFVKAEIAQKEEERNYGFMNRKNIPEGTGMLFVFEHDQILNFWMKNTPCPLSIAYITKYGMIKDI